MSVHEVFEDPWRQVKRRHSDLGTSSTSNGHIEHIRDSSSNDNDVLYNENKEQQYSGDTDHIRIYKRRFYILLVFSLSPFAQYCAWNTFGPISATVKEVFGWGNAEIALLAGLDAITYILTMLFFSWMMDVKGLRLSLLLSVFLMFIGTGLRCVTRDHDLAFWTITAGQFLNGLGGPVTQAAPPLLSSAWFPRKERTTATAVASLCGSLGVAFSFLIGPNVVGGVDHSSFQTSSEFGGNYSFFHQKLYQNKTLSLSARKDFLEKREDEIMRLLYIEFGVIAVLFFCVLLYFPDKPPTPPSMSASAEREDFGAGFKQLLRHKQFWTLAMIYGITTGVYSGWGAVLALNLESFDISQTQAGWIGFYSTIAGIIAGVMLARFSDFFGGRMKTLLLFLFFCSSLSFLWFSLLCLHIIPFSQASLYPSSIIGGFSISGTIPLFYELTVECTYPIAEGVTTGVLTLVNNIWTFVFLLVAMIPRIGTVWMNWCLFGSCAGCIPILLCFKERYGRLVVDREIEIKVSNDTEDEDLKEKTIFASTLSMTGIDQFMERLHKSKESKL